MKINMKNIKLDILDFSAIGTWLIVFGTSLYVTTSRTNGIPDNLVPIVFFNLTYIVSFIIVTHHFINPSNTKLIGSVIVAQLCSAFALMLLLEYNFLSILTVIWVAVLPQYLSIKKSIVVMLLMLVAWFGLYAIYWQNSNIIITALLYSSFHLFAILMAQQTISAEQSAIESARLNKELQSAQNLLEQATRQNERTRIARDLHDLVGHHLTALIINLQVAAHISQGEAKDKVEQCHSIAKLLLCDVREAVSVMRESESLDFRKMVAMMIDNIPELTIHNQIDIELNLEDLNLAKSLLSCVQEATTNCLRHSGASELCISMTEKDNVLLLELYDNGQLAKHFVLGNGLKGMQERVKQFNGEIAFKSEQKSMHISIKIPLSTIQKVQLS
jgi:two-component system sensor histidine kinase DesK